MNSKNEKFYTAAELAGVGGMPGTQFGCRKWLQREVPQYARPRTARGGGREYPINCLPPATQAALAGKALSAASTALARPLPPPPFAGSAASVDALSSTGRETRVTDAEISAQAASYEAAVHSRKDRAQRALRVVQAWHTLRLSGYRKTAASEAVGHKFGVAPSTLDRWLADTGGVPQDAWIYFLLDHHRGRTAIAGMSAEAWEILKADYLRLERPSAKACIRRLMRLPESRGFVLPKPRTMERRLAKIPRAIKVAMREGGKALKALYPPQQRDKTALAAMQIVNGDGYQHNLWVRFPDGEIVRAKTWFWQDVHSSKILAWRTDKTEHTDVIRLAFGDLVEDCGIPEAATIDNTHAAANKTMSGGVKHRFRFKVREDEPDGVFKLLGVDVRWTTPGHGQAKPIERTFGVGGIGEIVDKAPGFAGAWTGSSPIDKPEYGGKQRTVELSQLEAVISREIEAFNAMPGRRGSVQQGRSFDEVFAASYQRTQVRKATEEQRRLWLLATEPVRAHSKDGSLALDAGRIKGDRRVPGDANRYWHRELIEHAGRRLVARFDPRRLHQGVHVYSLDGRWLCYAECDRPAAFNDANAARERNRARNDWTRAVKIQAKAEVRMSALEADKALQLPVAGGPAHGSIPAPKVIRASFADPLQRPRFVPRERSAEERAEFERLEREFAAPAPVNVLDMRSDADKHAYWKSLAKRHAAGEQLADQEGTFFTHWQTQDYFRIATEAEAEFEQRLANG